jgi:hypothetical protein
VNTIRQYLFLETGDFAASIAGLSARLTWYLGSADLSWNDWLPFALWLLDSWMSRDDAGFQISPLGWVSICSSYRRSTLDSHFILEQLTSLGSVFFTFGPQILNSSSCEYLSSYVESSNFQRDIAELLILAEPYILHSPYMWVSDRFHIYSIQK